MDTGAATTTRDVLGLAVLSVMVETPSSCIEAVESVCTLCLPWLTPTRDVVACLVTDYCMLGYLQEDGRPQPRPTNRGMGCRGSECLAITEDGERELRRLALHGTGQPAHALMILCESLRLSVARRLDSQARAEILRGQIRARQRCLAVQRSRLEGAEGADTVLTRVLRHQIACAQAELDQLAGAEESQFAAAADPGCRSSRCPAACLPLTLDKGGLQ